MEILQEAVPVLCHPHSEKVFPAAEAEPPVFQFVPLPLVLSLDITEKSLALSSFHPPSGYLYTLMRSPLSLLISRLNSPISLSFPPQKKCSSSLNILAMALCSSEESGSPPSTAGSAFSSPGYL